MTSLAWKFGRLFLASGVFSSAVLAYEPYATDANTLFLYHFDESAAGTLCAPAVAGRNNVYPVDLTSSAANEALLAGVLGATGCTGLGNCANLGTNTGYALGYDGNGDLNFDGETSTADRVALSTLGIGGTNPFTLEAVVSPNADPAVNREIICTDSSATTRGFQFRITTGGGTGRRLEFNCIGLSGANVFAEIPVSGGNALNASSIGKWYHAAFVYDGTNCRFYWTELQPGVYQANPIGSSQPLSLTGAGAVNGNLVFGNENRAAGGEGLQGKIDEVRISNTARAANGFFISADTDNDNLPDEWERFHFADLTRGAADDPDNDSHDNAAEFAAGSDPDLAASYPGNVDGDGLPDAWETQYFSALTYGDSDDPDSDSFTNLQEHSAGSQPDNGNSTPSDTDADGLPDSWEDTNFGSLSQTAAADPDQDGFTNLQEQTGGTNPNDDQDYPGAQPVPSISVLEASAGSEAVNPPANTIDGNTSTRWSNSGDGQWITYDLGGNFQARGVSIHFYNGNARIYHFDILVSTDNVTWTTALQGAASSGTATGAEPFSLPGNPVARYVRYVGHMNNVNTYNSYWEIQFDAVAATDTDDDGLPDWWETQSFSGLTQTAAGDPDLDTLTNLQEYQLGSHPNVANDPNNVDDDGLPDAWELTYFAAIWAQNAAGNPDGDAYTNLQEYQLGKNPIVYDDPNDSDSDGLPDDWELNYFSSLAHTGTGDQDGDGFNNAAEYSGRTNPADTASMPGDGDSDGLQDEWELLNFGSLAPSAPGDPDADGFSNLVEQSAATDPNDPQSYAGTVADPAKPDGLMVDLLAHPSLTTIPDTQPEFTWIFRSRTRGEMQSAYEIIVSSGVSLAAAGSGDVWSSGKVLSSSSVNVPCGVPLTRGTTRYWRVRTWGGGIDPGAWSAIQPFTIESTSPQSGARTIYKNAASASAFAGRYQPAYNTSVPPVSLINKGGGNYFIDFGKDAFGFVRVRMNGAYSGTTMEVRMGEKASGNSVNTAPGGTIRYVTTNVALSDGDVTYDVRKASTTTGINISWSGGVTPFRYVELLNCPASLTMSDVRQMVLHVPFQDTAAAFSSSNATLDSVWDLCAHTIKATTFCGVYVDGDRERKPYEADAYINQLCHYGVDREYATARYSYEYLLDNHTWPLEWRFHFPLMAWEDYMQTGNAEALAANYTAIKNYLLMGNERASDGAFVSTNPGNVQTDPADIIDWPAVERDGYALSSSNSVSAVPNAFHYGNLRLMAKIASALGNTTDAADFANRADRLQAVFSGSAFWNGSTYKDGEAVSHVSAHANFFALAMGAVPDARKTAVLDYLVTRRMPCSVYGAQYLLEALFEGGREDHAIGLMADNDAAYVRSWSNMIRVGSTMTLESWDASVKSNLDWNHAWGAAPANIIPRYVMGVTPLTPGFATIQIKPRLGTGSAGAGLTNASGTVPTIRGPVTLQIENSPATFKLLVNIPGNMSADIHIPSKGLGGSTLIYDGVAVAATVSGDRLMLQGVPSGRHAIWLSASSSPSASVLKENWKAMMFGADASNAAVSGDSADPDGDGLTNSREYLGGTDPMVSDDVDLDGLLDAWEITHFGNLSAQTAVADADGDGTDNLTEQRLGLDPNSGTSRFAASWSGNTITWPGAAGLGFTIQRSIDLSGWQNLVTQSGTAGANTYTDTSPPSGHAWYRVKLEP